MTRKICKYYRIFDCEKLCKHQLQPIIESKEAIIFWVFAIKTDWKIKNNRPNIVVTDYKRKTWLLIDIIHQLKNMIISKNKDLGIEIEKIWHLKTITRTLNSGSCEYDQERDR